MKQTSTTTASPPRRKRNATPGSKRHAIGDQDVQSCATSNRPKARPVAASTATGFSTSVEGGGQTSALLPNRQCLDPVGIPDDVDHRSELLPLRRRDLGVRILSAGRDSRAEDDQKREKAGAHRESLHRCYARRA